MHCKHGVLLVFGVALSGIGSPTRAENKTIEALLESTSVADLYTSAAYARVERLIAKTEIVVYHKDVGVFTTLGAGKSSAALSNEVARRLSLSEIKAINANLAALPSAEGAKAIMLASAKNDIQTVVEPLIRDKLSIEGHTLTPEQERALEQQFRDLYPNDAPLTAAEQRNLEAEKKVRESVLSFFTDEYLFEGALKALFGITSLSAGVITGVLHGEDIGNQGFTAEEAERAAAQFNSAAKAQQERIRAEAAQAAREGGGGGSSAAAAGRDFDLGHDQGDRAGTSGASGGFSGGGRSSDRSSGSGSSSRDAGGHDGAAPEVDRDSDHDFSPSSEGPEIHSPL